MRILTVGDIVGLEGLKKLEASLPQLKKDECIDFCIVNGENVADGMGINEKCYRAILNAGADVVTLGNHTWAKKEVFNFIDDEKIVRPANYSNNNPGKGFGIYEANNKKIAVINLIGRVGMNVLSDNPFTKAKEIIDGIKDKVDYIVVDFHAEATAEKIALGYYLDGKANIVFGTHTHVQTSDEVILDEGTGFITDIGMTGPIKSVIGMDIGASLKRFETSIPERYKVADDKAKLNSCIFEINDELKRVVNIKRVNL